MSEKYIMLSLDDEKTGVLAEVLQNKTCKKILAYLAEKESSEGDISRKLGIPANTVNYDIKKLLEAGLIEKSESFFWSVKGKKMPQYKVSKKTIMISPKNSNSVKSVLGAFLITGIAAFFLKIYTSAKYASVNTARQTVEDFSRSAVDGGKVAANSGVVPTGPINPGNLVPAVPFPEVWVWFLLGGLVALLCYMLLNWRKL